MSLSRRLNSEATRGLQTPLGYHGRSTATKCLGSPQKSRQRWDLFQRRSIQGAVLCFGRGNEPVLIFLINYSRKDEAYVCVCVYTCMCTREFTASPAFAPRSLPPSHTVEIRCSWRHSLCLFMIWGCGGIKAGRMKAQKLPVSSCFPQQRLFFPKMMLPFKGFLICKLFPQFISLQ